MDTSVSDPPPEPDSGYFSPPSLDGENQFTFETSSGLEATSKEKLRQLPEIRKMELDISRGMVFQRRRRSFSDPFPSKAKLVDGGRGITYSYSCSETLSSTVTLGVQTCELYPTHAFCRCRGCSSTSGPGLPSRPVAVVQPLKRQWSAEVYANEDEDVEMDRVRMISVDLGRRLQIIADDLEDQRRNANDGFNLGDLFRVNFMQVFFDGLAAFFNF